MDWSSLIASMAISLIITVFAYLFVPVILCLRGKKYKLSTIRKIVIINSLCVWLIFNVIRINAGDDGGEAGVILWSAVAYWLMKKKCLAEETEETAAERDDPWDVDNRREKSKRKSPWKIVFTAILSVVLVTSVSISALYLIEQFEEHQTAEAQREKPVSTSTVTQQARPRPTSTDPFIVYTVKGDEEWYHTSSCHCLDDAYYTSRTIGMAESLGYSPCPDCH
ncbi:MAG: hypothetical protein ACOX81_09525 [Candidatus Heteroscillospira sp.]|jgi:hypothetical protein